MSTSNLFAGLTEKKETKDGDTLGTGSKDKEISVGAKLKGLFSIKSHDSKKHENDKHTLTIPHTDSPAASASPGGSASPGWPHTTGQTSLSGLGLSGKKHDKSDTGKSSTTSSAKGKFLEFFKTDAEKRLDREREQREKQSADEARTKARKEEEPVKLELKSARTDAGAQPIVGEPIKAEAFTLRSGGISEPLLLLGTRGVCRWFRASADGFDQIVESVAPLYVPSVDDVGCRVCCQWVMDESASAGADGSAGQAQQSSFGEIGPIQLDPSIAQASLDCFQGGKAVFTVRQQETDELCQITVKRTMIRILPAGGGEVKCSFMLLHKPATATTAASSSPVKFLLDCIDPLRFSIEDAAANKSFRGSVVTHGEPISQARRERDVMACLIRRIIKTGSEALMAEAKQTSTGSDVPAGTVPLNVSAHHRVSTTNAASSAHSSSAASMSNDLVSVHVRPSSGDTESDPVAIEIQPAAATFTILTSAPSITMDEANAAIDPSSPLDSSPTPTKVDMSHLSITNYSSSPAPVSIHSASASPLAASPSPAGAATITHQSPTQILSLTKRISELTAEKNLFKENINLIMVEKAKAEAEAKTQLEQLQASFDRKNEELATMAKRLDQRDEDVDALKLAIQNLSDQMSTLANTEIRLSNEIRLCKQERDHAIQELKQSKESHTSKLSEKDDLYTKLLAEKQAYLDQVAALSGELQLSRTEVKRLTTIEEKYARLQETESNLRHDLGVYKQDLSKCKDIQTKLDCVEMENHQLRKRMEKLRGTEHTPNAHTAAPLHTPNMQHDSPSLDFPLVQVDPNTPAATSVASANPQTDDALDLVASDTLKVPRSGSSTPLPRTAAITHNGASDSSVAQTAAYHLLSEQHAQLQSQYAELNAAHTATLADLVLAQQQLSALHESDAKHTQALTELTTKYETLLKAHDESVANRNYYKRKCDSLASNLDKMLNQSGSTPEPVASKPTGGLSASSSSSSLVDRDRVERETHTEEVKKLHSMIHTLRTENSQLNQAVAAYKKTLETNYQLLKHERDANLLLSQKSSSSTTGGIFQRGSKQAQLLQQFESVRALANSLSEIITDKDLSIDHLKKSNLVLGSRIFHLETKFAKELDEAGEPVFNGKIDLDEEERKYQQSRSASAQHSRDVSLQGSAAPSEASTPTAAPRSFERAFDTTASSMTEPSSSTK